MTIHTSIDPCIRAEMGKWLKMDFEFSHFVTLATNDAGLSPATMRRRLKSWDARVNRALYGPKWQKHQDELIWFFAFLEKPSANPHWHLMLRIVGRWNEDPVSTYSEFHRAAFIGWKQLMPSGTIDVQAIRAGYSSVEEYVLKELRGAIQYSSFVTPDELRH
ncbi:MAG: hypothetical protein JJ969_17140 [Rhizobiaceae bacterium]|nr:hypothetical protein [Rhizobiaceae bacterium]